MVIFFIDKAAIYNTFAHQHVLQCRCLNMRLAPGHLVPLIPTKKQDSYMVKDFLR